MTTGRILVSGALLLMLGASLFVLGAPWRAAIASEATLVAMQQCIPCSASHPCTNPLTACSVKPGKSHGCCIGYAP